MTTKPKRKPGRPKKTERPVTPEVKAEIARLYLQGRTEHEIGVVIGVARSTVQYHLDQEIKPLWRQGIICDANTELARADLVIRLAFEGFERSKAAQEKQKQKFEVEAATKKIKRAAPRGTKRERLVERIAETVGRDGDKAWLELVAVMMAFKAKVRGLYAPTRHRLEVETELRVAGLTPGQLDEAMLGRAAELLVERQRHQALMRGMHGEN